MTFGGTILDIENSYRTHSPTNAAPDATNWSVRLTQEAIDNRRSIIIDSTLGGSAEHFIQRFQQLHGRGYTIEIHVIGVHRMVSRLGIYLRYETNSQHAPERMVSMAVHDRNYHALPQNLQRLHEACGNLIGSISIYSRGQALELDRTYHTEFPCDINAAIRKLTAIRNTPFTLDDELSFNLTTAQVRQMIETRGADPRQFLEDVRL